MGPKDLGGIFQGIFRVYGAGFIGIVIVVALVEVPLSILSIWFGSNLENAAVDQFGEFNNETFEIPHFIEAFRTVFYLGIILVIATVLSFVIMEGALIFGVSGQVLWRRIPVVQAYSFAGGRFGAMLGASILAGLGVLLMAITIIGIPFAIFFAVRWYFVMQTASLERCSPWAAMARSADLVRDNWWRVFGILLLIGILVAIAEGIASAVLGLIPYVGPIVASVLFAPVMIIAQTLLYHDLRVRRDGLDGYNSEVLAVELQSPRGL